MEGKRFITHLAAGLIFPAVLEILQTAAQRSYENAWTTFLIFLSMHPHSIRNYVKSVLERRREEIEKAAKKEIEDMYGASLEELLEDEKRGLLTGARRTWIETRSKHLLLVGMEALADAWEKHGLVWFSGSAVIMP
ncbi:MAG: hypothetical protein QW794_02885 [Thermosphaera sp.]